MKKFLVNIAAWDGPKDLPDGWIIANAPRPLNGERTWQGQFRHGVLYAAQPAQPEGDDWDRERHAAILRNWESIDAWQVEFITDAEIAARCITHAKEFGFADLDALKADGITIAELAAGKYPWMGGDYV
jgi:hypothetical protein